MVQQVRRYTLNEKQKRLLGLLYKFRYVTTPLLGQYLGISKDGVYQSLAILEDQKLIGKKYSKSYRLAGLPARYYLALEGLKILSKDDYYDPLILHAMRKNPGLSDQYIDRQLQAFEIYTKINNEYPKRFNTYTRVEMTHVDGFIEPTPDLYLESTKENKPSYFVELQSANQLFVLRKRVAAIVEHYDSGGWERGDYPDTLVVCDSPQSEKTIQEYIAQLLESTGVDDEIRFLITTQRALTNQEKKIWTNPLVLDTLLTL